MDLIIWLDDYGIFKATSIYDFVKDGKHFTLIISECGYDFLIEDYHIDFVSVLHDIKVNGFCNITPCFSKVFHYGDFMGEYSEMFH